MALSRYLVTYVLVLLGTGLFAATPVRPVIGVQAKIDVETALAGAPGSSPSTAKLHSYFQSLLAGLLANPAVSGLTVGQHWDTIQSSSTTYDWSYLDDAFAAAVVVNAPVRLIITPGVNSPVWLLNSIPACDSLFTKGSAPANCGTVTFAGAPEPTNSDGNVLPLPWNSVYQTAWTGFLNVLNARYKANPLFAGIAISGPVDASDEIIYPTSQNDTAAQSSSLTVDAMWAALIQNAFPSTAAYQNTDQVFIDRWKQTIDLYESIFSGITLFLSPDAGNDLPEFGQNVTPHPDNTLFTQDCAGAAKKNDPMSCEAKTEILSYFVSVSGPNGKATEVGGMTASSPVTAGDIGIPGIKILDALSPAPAIPFSGGAQFDYPVSSKNIQAVGCPTPNAGCPGLTPEVAAYNVLGVFFYGTPAANFYGGVIGTAPIQYVEVSYMDIQYAAANPCPAAPSALLGSMSLQDLLNRANRDLLAMANQTKTLPLATCASSVPAPSIALVANAEGEIPTIAANTWVEIKGTNLAPAGDTRIWNSGDFVGGQMPTQLDQVSATVNGQSAYVYYISPTQINILTPPQAISGPVTVVVNNRGTASLPFVAPAQAISPSFFVFNGGPYVIATHLNGTLVGPTTLYPGSSTPAQPGEEMVLYANGFGPTSTAIVPGSGSQSGMLSPMPVVTIGGFEAEVSYAGLVSPGLFQFNVTVPSNAASGDNAITATYQGVGASPAELITIAGLGPPPTNVTYYVSPNGSDLWSGTLPAPNANHNDGPFATFDHARAFVRTLDKAGLSRVNVQFRAGTYFLPATEMFTAADSGSATMQIAYQNYPGESPVFSGGMRIANWTNTNGDTWQTTLPAASTQYFETLFYNGARRLRPRLGVALGTNYRILSTVYLNAPAPPAAAPSASCSIYVTGSGWECYDRFQYEPTDPIAGNWTNLAPAENNPCGQTAGNQSIAGDIEVLVFEQFTSSKLKISCIDTAAQIVYMTGPTPISKGSPTRNGFITGNRYLVENVQNALTQPGQWFLDRSNANSWTLTYLGNPGENPNSDTVIVPQLAQLLVTTGLQYVTFQGLTFEHDNYTIPAAGYPSYELEPGIPAAVSFQNSQHIAFDSNIVTQTSGTGLEFLSCINQNSAAYCATTDPNAANANNTIEDSALFDIGALGIRIGGPYLVTNTDANDAEFFTVQNNVVEGYGRTIPASFGIGQGLGHDNLYTHNDVYDGYHCAISISQPEPPTATNTIGNANNTISFNHVYNLLEGIMNDGGSIRIDAGNSAYTAPGNKIVNNKIHDVTDASIQDANGYGGDGVYLDNQTGLVDVENNLIYRVSAKNVNSPQGPALPSNSDIIKNNILAYARNSAIGVANPYPNGVPAAPDLVFNISNNIFYFDRLSTSTPQFWVQGGCEYSGGYSYTGFQLWNSNVFWRTDGAFATDTKAFYVQPNAAPKASNAPCSDSTNDYTFYTFAAWQKFGEDVQSIVLNPGFANPVYPNDDYSLPKGSPGAGFVPFDLTLPGRANPVLMPPPVAPTFVIKLFDPTKDY